MAWKSCGSVDGSICYQRYKLLYVYTWTDLKFSTPTLSCDFGWQTQATFFFFFCFKGICITLKYWRDYYWLCCSKLMDKQVWHLLLLYRFGQLVDQIWDYGLLLPASPFWTRVTCWENDQSSAASHGISEMTEWGTEGRHTTTHNYTQSPIQRVFLSTHTVLPLSFLQVRGTFPWLF